MLYTIFAVIFIIYVIYQQRKSLKNQVTTDYELKNRRAYKKKRKSTASGVDYGTATDSIPHSGGSGGGGGSGRSWHSDNNYTGPSDGGSSSD